ncbi:MAG: sugar phosphate isomerase/epimerase [Chloroflexi bacterium]|nr:sugar phosphate isomerase/epimerase [Chloroflexota bacterium]
MNELAIFSKPWKSLPLPDLAEHIRSLGFELIELPVRPGFQVEPETIERDLPAAVKLLGEQGIRVLNVTAALAIDDERLYSACATAGIKMNRVMFWLRDLDYWAAEAEARRQLDSALPLCERYDVQIGVQNHSGKFVPVNEMGAYHLLKDYDPRYVAAVWDPAHNALEGMDSDAALDVLAPYLCVVNLKNAYWRRVTGPEANAAEWKIYWTSGAQGRASWSRVIAKLKAIDYQGPICFSAEYSDEERVDELIVQDLAFARRLLAGD